MRHLRPAAAAASLAVLTTLVAPTATAADPTPAPAAEETVQHQLDRLVTSSGFPGAIATVRDATGDVRTYTSGTGDLETVNGGIRGGSGLVVAGDIETVNGGIFLDSGSRVSGGASTVNGAIGLVRTELGGGIETVSGDITVGIGSHVKGGIKVEKPGKAWLGIHFGKPKPPRIVIGPDAVVDGPLVFEREVKLYVHSSAKTGPIRGATAIRFQTPTAPQD